MCDRQLSRLATLVLPLSVVAVPAHSQTIYVADACTNKIQRVEPGGSDVEDLVVRELGTPTALVVDPLEGKIYWADTDSRWRKIRRANLDGSGIEDVVEMDPRRPDDLAIDPSGRRLYWGASGPGDDCRLQRSNLDGTAIETVRDLPQPVFSLALDAVNGKLYWVDSLGELIRRANLDGSEGEDVIATGMDFVEDLTIDPAGGKAYWCGANYGVSGGHVRRANLDGSDAEELLTLDFWPRGGIQVDSKAGKLYWTTQSDVHRANLDGSNVEHLAHVHWGQLHDLALDASAGGMYWANEQFGSEGPFKIQRATLDGSGVEDVVATAVYRPTVITLDAGAGKIFWANGHRDWDTVGSIFSADLDGSKVEEVRVGGRTPRAFALDPAGSRIYWHDGYDGTIRRAGLDGSNVEELISTGSEVAALALDTVGGKIYWTDVSSYKILRADLNGSHQEELVGHQMYLLSPAGLALDLEARKMYWTDGRVVRRAALDGTHVEDVIVVERRPTIFLPPIALDVARGHIYWAVTEDEIGVIRRANLDGSDVADVVSLPFRFCPNAIALDCRAPVPAALDIRPGSCPNPVNVRSRGVVQMAITGTGSFDAAEIDVDSLVLKRTDGVGGSLAPIKRRSAKIGAVEDVTTPFDAEPCECHELAGDGYDDLLIKFSTLEMTRILELGSEAPGSPVMLTVSGSTLDGTAFVASDCILLVGSRASPRSGDLIHGRGKH